MAGWSPHVCCWGKSGSGSDAPRGLSLTLSGHQRGLPVPLFDKYDTATNSGGSMMRRASIGIALLALSHLAFANASSALAQAGSTGGTIGKQDKSIAGDVDRPPAATPKRKEVKARRNRSALTKSASEPPKPQSTETPQEKFANSPTCTNVRAACEKTASKFGVGPGRGPAHLPLQNACRRENGKAITATTRASLGDDILIRDIGVRRLARLSTNEMSPIGTNQTSSDVRSSVAIGGKRTWRCRSILVAIDPQRTRDKNYGWRLVPVRTARLRYHSISFHH